MLSSIATNYFSCIPHDILWHILLYLDDYKDLKYLSRVDRRFHTVIGNNKFWKQYYSIYVNPVERRDWRWEYLNNAKRKSSRYIQWNSISYESVNYDTYGIMNHKIYNCEFLRFGGTELIQFIINEDFEGAHFSANIHSDKHVYITLSETHVIDFGVNINSMDKSTIDVPGDEILHKMSGNHTYYLLLHRGVYTFFESENIIRKFTFDKKTHFQIKEQFIKVRIRAHLQLTARMDLCDVREYPSFIYDYMNVIDDMK
jgi:hypothetical protein